MKDSAPRSKADNDTGREGGGGMASSRSRDGV